MTKQKFQTLQQIRSQPQEHVYSDNLFLKKNGSSRCVLSMHKLSKHDHVIYGAAKVNTS